MISVRGTDDVSGGSWKLSSYCSGGGCVGVRPVANGVEVASTLTSGPSLEFTREEWTAFVAGVKNGEFDLD